MRRFVAVLLGLCALTAVAAPAASAKGSLDMYVARVSQAKAAQLLKKGWDITDIRNRGRTALIDVVLTRAERNRLAASGVKLRLKRTKSGKTVRQVAAAQAAGGYTVYRSWDEPGGIRDELYQVARDNPRLVKLEVIGHTIQGREIIALKVTKKARHYKDGSRPAALYTATQHAREWISTEVDRRTLHWFIDRYNAGNSQIRKLLRHTELWFVPVANPDGYQYTFDHERLWRKNLRNNDSDPAITGVDGVDPNRNFNEHWKYDNEGSSSITASETFRGPGPASEPETQAMQGLIRKVDPEMHSNFHSYGPLILFPQGWLVGAPDADNPIYTALGGTDANAAIAGFDPGLSAEELYVTNGETTDFADVNTGAISFTPELDEGCPGCGFVFPDDEAAIQAEFEKVLPFSLSLARSADNPANPDTRDTTKMTVKPFYLSQNEVDPENRALSMFDFRFTESYGDPQDVRVLAKRSLGAVTLKYRINGGRTQSASTSEWKTGETYGVGNANYYRVMRGFVQGTDPGDSVEVWFQGRHGHKKSDSFTYEAVSESGKRTLLLSAEDYTGLSPAQDPAGPHYLDYYEQALANNGIAYDVYDVDAHDRTAPDALGVLSHYDAVLWYTGDDLVVREQGQAGGTSSRLALQELYAVRDFMNEGGRVGYVGKNAGSADTTAVSQYYDPFENRDCEVTADSQALFCRPLFGSGDGVNDVLEYWLGAGLVNVGAGANFDDEGNFLNAFDVMGVDNPFSGLAWEFNGPDTAQNQDGNLGPNSYITTSGLMPPSEYPQFNSWVSARYDRPGGPFDPHSGEFYVHSQIADVSYKRLTRTVDVPAGGGTLTFWTSYNTEPDWDFMFVEAHTVGQDNWTTLPDQNGHTSDNTGDSCPEGWNELHPWLERYQTVNADGTCSPTGTSGTWNAASGSSGGWQQWSINLNDYAGQQIEISISYASDWATQGLGVFLDDVNLLGQETSFETGFDGWDVAGPPPGSAPNANDFERITGAGFPEGAAVSTDDSLIQGYGVEGITGQEARDQVVGRTMQYLLR